MKCVVVTGGAGFIGSHTCLLLLERGYSVFIIDSLANSFIDTIDRIKKLFALSNKKNKNKIYFYKSDLKDCNALENIFEEIKIKSFDIESVFHFAGFKSASKSIDNPIEYWNNNLMATINLIRISCKYSCKNLIFSSSAIVYGNENNTPLKEDSIVKPLNPYGHTKQAIENILFDVTNQKESRMRVICLRYFNPIGAHVSGKLGENAKNISENLFPLICEVAAGKRKKLIINGEDWPTFDGTCIRDYIHIMDLAEAHIKALEYLKTNGKNFLILNVGTGKGTSVKQLVNTFEKTNKISIDYDIGERRKGDSAISYANSEYSHSILKWRPNRNLETMCLDGWKWYLYLINEKK